MNRRIFALAFVTALVVGVLPGVAFAHGTDFGEDPIYLSMGTSLAAGSQADANGDTTLFSDQSYTDVLYQRLRWFVDRDLAHVKLGCAGETLDSIDNLNPACLANPAYDPSDHRSQLDTAREVLATGRVALVTIDIGANDIFGLSDLCGSDPGCILGALPGVVEDTALLIGEIAAYGAPVVAMNYYNPQAIAVQLGEAAYPEVALSTAVVHAFGALLDGAIAPIPVVDVFEKYRAGDLPLEVQAYYPFFGLPPELVPDVAERRIDNFPRNEVPDAVDFACVLTYMCPDKAGVNPNIHPTPAGYRVIARGFLWEVLRTYEL